MRSFADILSLAEDNKGGTEALERSLSSPLSRAEIEKISEDRWLSTMTKCVFQVGFNWQLIEDKWDRFEEVFEGFDVARWSMMSDDDVDSLLSTKGIVAHGAKIRSVGGNAAYLNSLATEHGSAGQYFAGWSGKDYCDNLRALQKGGERLGGRTGQIALRRTGVDTLIFSPDVLKALERDSIVSKMPSSQRDFGAVQAAIDTWRQESGRPLTQISQILAFSVG